MEFNMTLRDYVRIIFRQKVILFLSIFVIMTIVTVGLVLRTPMYQGSVKMLISGEKQVESLFYKELMAMRENEASLTQSQIVTSDPVLRHVVDALKLYNKPFNYESAFATPLKRKLIKLQDKMYKAQIERLPKEQQFSYNYRRSLEELRSNIEVEPLKGTKIFIIHVKDFDRVGAAVLANVVSRAYVTFDIEQQLAELQQKYGEKHSMVIQLQDNIKRMNALLTGLPLSNQEALGSASVKIIEQASIPNRPIGGKGKLIFLAALLASVFMGIMLAFLFEYMDQSIKSTHDVENVLGVPLFGSIPLIRINKQKKMPKRFNLAFQNLSDQLRLMMNINAFKTVLVLASDIKEGASTIVANFGVHVADGGAKRVLIIDANFHQPAMHQIFKISDSPGLADVLTEKASLEQVIKPINPTLFVLPAGQTAVNPVIFLDSPKTREFLEKLKAQYDLILIDCAELSSSQEGCLLASMVDKTIFVVSENQTRRPVAIKALAKLKEHKASILGAVLNKRTYPIPGILYKRV